jgi:hypothetical protein
MSQGRQQKQTSVQIDLRPTQTDDFAAPRPRYSEQTEAICRFVAYEAIPLQNVNRSPRRIAHAIMAPSVSVARAAAPRPPRTRATPRGRVFSVAEVAPAATDACHLEMSSLVIARRK